MCLHVISQFIVPHFNSFALLFQVVIRHTTLSTSFAEKIFNFDLENVHNDTIISVSTKCVTKNIRVYQRQKHFYAILLWHFF